MICYLIIILILFKSFILYYFASNIFNVLKMSIIFDIKKKSLRYVFTMLISFFDY